jgi:hypothetical protein
MKLKKAIILSVIVSFFYLQGSSQQCTDPASILSAYYSYAPNSKFGIGIEAGKLSSESPLGIFAGCTFQLYNDRHMKTDTTVSDDMVSNIYFKGAYRLTRIENVLSVFVVASPQYSLQSGFDLQAGTRFIFPLSGRMGIGVEPVYSIRQNCFLVNFQIAFCVR